MTNIFYHFGGLTSKVAIVMRDSDDLEEVLLKATEIFSQPIVLIWLENGTVSEASSGNRDEVNNEIYHTYLRHHQPFNLLIKRKVGRRMDLKVDRVLSSILMPLSSSLNNRHLLSTINGDRRLGIALTKDIDFIKEKVLSGYLRNVAMEVIQLLYLLEGTEVFTVEETVDRYPQLQPIFDGKDTPVLRTQLNFIKNLLIKTLERIKI